MIVAEINEFDAKGDKVDYVAYNKLLNDLRAKFEDADFEVQIIGFAKQIGDIADGAEGAQVLRHGPAADHHRGLLVLPLAAFTLLPVACSLVAGVAVRHPAPARLRARSAGGAGALPGVRHRRLARRAADQYIVRGIASGQSCEAARASFRAC
jgi:hypothetical protein